MTNEQIIAAGQQIYDETEVGANTSERIGGVIKGIGQRLATRDTEVDEALTQLANQNAGIDAKNGYYTNSQAANESALTVTAPGYVLSAGGNIRIKMAHANTASSVTLNINNTGAKALYYNGETVSPENTWQDNETIVVYYDGESYYATNSLGGGGGSEDLDERVEAIEEQLSAPAGMAPTYTVLPKLEIEPGVYVKTGARLNGNVGSAIVETSTLPTYPGYKYIKLDVHSYVGKEIAIRCKSASNTKDYIFTDSSNTIIATDNMADSNILTVPANSYYLYLNHYLTAGGIINPTAALVNSSASGDIGYLRDTVDEISEDLVTVSTGEIETELITGKMLNGAGEIVETPSYSVTGFINVIPGNDYSFTGSLSSNHSPGICGYDDNNVPQCILLQGTSSDYIFENAVFTIPFGVTKIVANGVTAAGITIKGTQRSSKLDELHELSENVVQIQETLDNLPSGGETEKEILEEVSLGTLIIGYVKVPPTTDLTDITVAENQTGYVNTDYIQVEQGEKLYVSCAAYMQAQCVQGYKLVNGVYTWVKTIIASNNVCYKQEFTIEQGIEFIRINSQFSWTMRLWRKKTVPANTVTKKAIHKNVRWVGMSIWAFEFKILGNGFGGNVRAKGYQSLLNEQFDFDWDNSCLTSHSGNSLGAVQADVDAVNNSGVHTYGSSIILRMYDEYETGANANYDALSNAIWTLDTITNDFRREIPLGTTDDYENNTGPLTYYGALRMFADKVIELSGTDAIVIAANSLRRNNSGYTSTSTNHVGCTLEDYEKALMYAVVKNGWYFVDQFRLSGITDNTITLTTVDGLHLNNTGYKLAVLPWIAVFDQIYNKLLDAGV